MARHVLRGMAAGFLAGAAASWVMNEFQAMRPQRRQGDDTARERGAREAPESQERKEQESSGMDENATVQTAVAISRNVFHHELSESGKQIAGPAVHYAYGATVGALYGGLAELLPGVSAALGLPFGFAVWLLGDEIAVPALGLARRPTEYPPRVHADALAAHFMYGAATDLFRRVLRHVI